MSDSKWKYGSGRSGKPRPRIDRSRKMKCPQCKQDVILYSDGELERHKVYIYKDGKRTRKYTMCPRKKL